MTRAEQITQFIHASGWAAAEVSPLAGDASNRRYERLRSPDGTCAVLMDAPPEKNTNVQQFVTIARHLHSCGLSAPAILHEDAENGFLLIEDLGDQLFARALETRPACEDLFYSAAADVLSLLHKTPPLELPRYDSPVTVPLAALSYDWYRRCLTEDTGDSAKTRFQQAFTPIIAPFDADLTVLIQRDYHAENLLWLPERQGAARVGLLDFQDAMLGHPVYDLVSVLQDARRDVSPRVAEHTKSRFMAQSGITPASFDLAYAVFGLQRNLRILGVFARLCLRDSKSHYVDFMPRVWDHIQTNLAHPALSDMAAIIRRDLPAPTPDALYLLKSKAGTWAGR